MSFRRVCTNCSFLTSKLAKFHGNSSGQSSQFWTPLAVRCNQFATEANQTKADNQPKYFQGKRIVEEEIDPYKIENLLLTITGYDATVLDSFSKFVQIAAKMTDVDLTKRKSGSQLRKEQMQYNLKKHQRIVQVANLTEDKVDIFVDYLNEKLPCGVQIKLELKKWEELVAPNHPSLQKIERTVSRYQK